MTDLFIVLIMFVSAAALSGLLVLCDRVAR
jgi:hypothetical protein